jgi:hypothetical protein
MGRMARAWRVREFFRDAAADALRAATQRAGATNALAGETNRDYEERRAAAERLYARALAERGLEYRPHEPDADAYTYVYYARELGWKRADVDGEDFWFITRDYPLVLQRQKALEQYLDAYHQTQIRGPEGEQEHFDEKGKRIKSGARVQYRGYKAYLERLLASSQGVPDEVFELMQEMKDLDEKMARMSRFFGRVSG